VSGERQNGGRARGARLHLLVVASALPLLAGCSSSSKVDYASDAFPSQSLVDLLKETKSAPPAAPSAAQPAPSTTEASLPPASAAPPAREAPPVSSTAAASPPPPATTSAENDDPVAAAYPSVSLIDLVTGRKPGSQ